MHLLKQTDMEIPWVLMGSAQHRTSEGHTGLRLADGSEVCAGPRTEARRTPSCTFQRAGPEMSREEFFTHYGSGRRLQISISDFAGGEEKAEGRI